MFSESSVQLIQKWIRQHTPNFLFILWSKSQWMALRSAQPETWVLPLSPDHHLSSYAIRCYFPWLNLVVIHQSVFNIQTLHIVIQFIEQSCKVGATINISIWRCRIWGIERLRNWSKMIWEVKLVYKPKHSVYNLHTHNHYPICHRTSSIYNVYHILLFVLSPWLDCMFFEIRDSDFFAAGSSVPRIVPGKQCMSDTPRELRSFSRDQSVDKWK